jgi:hypothetical protein
MSATRSRRATAFAALASIALLASIAGSASAAYTMDFPAGVACDFALSIDVGDGGPQHYQQITDEEGNVLWWLSAGRGNPLTFTNVDSGATLSLDATGATWKTVNYPDGSFTQTLIGQNLLILFPTDVPAGPSTTLHVGRVVVDSDPFYNFTVRTVSGTATDICAALSD